MMPPTDAAPQTKVFVGRLSSATKSLDLRKLFERYGEVTECDVLGTYGFVHMKSVDQAETAIQKLNGTELHGTRISVEQSTGQKGRGGGRGRGGGPMRGSRGNGGFRGRGSDRFSPYGRSYPPAGDSYDNGGGYSGGYGDGYGSSGGGYSQGGYGQGNGGGYSTGYSQPSYGNGYNMDRRPPPVRTAVGGYYDDYDRRDPYPRSPAPRPAYDPYDRRPPPRDPYAGQAYDSRAPQGGYDRRDDYADMYSRRSPPRYQTEAAPARGYEYDRYAAAPRGASPPRRYAPQHRELTTVRRY